MEATSAALKLRASFTITECREIAIKVAAIIAFYLVGTWTKIDIITLPNFNIILAMRRMMMLFITVERS